MRALVLHDHGGNPRVEEHPVPVAAGELRVIDVLAAGLNPDSDRLASTGVA
jgi:NADPH:quinone reductase-like Zn-dependent oxidoreductase